MLEPAPRVAVNARGQAVAAWIDTKDRVRVAVATRPGRFGAAITLAKSGLRPNPTIAADGMVTVVWEQGEASLRFVRGKAGRFGSPKRLAPGSKREDGSAHAAAQPDGSVAVVYESEDELRTVTLSPAGKPSAPVTLGEGGFGHDSVRVAADGTVAACCVAPVAPETGTKVAVYRGEWTLASIPALGEDGRIETVFASAAQLILGVIDVRTEGDAGVSGIPGSAVAGEDHVLGAPRWASVSKPTRGLAPDVTIDGSGPHRARLPGEDGAAGVLARRAGLRERRGPRRPEADVEAGLPADGPPARRGRDRRLAGARRQVGRGARTPRALRLRTVPERPGTRDGARRGLPPGVRPRHQRLLRGAHLDLGRRGGPGQRVQLSRRQGWRARPRTVPGAAGE